MFGEIVAQIAACERVDRLARAEDRATERLPGEGRRMEQVEHDIVRRIVGGADLLGDDVFFARQFLAVEDRIGEDVVQDVDRERHVVLQHPRVIGGGLDAGRGIDLAADILDFFGDAHRRPGHRALEGHMFEQVGNSVLGRRLVARPRPDPDPERGAFQPLASARK